MIDRNENLLKSFVGKTEEELSTAIFGDISTTTEKVYTKKADTFRLMTEKMKSLCALSITDMTYGDIPIDVDTRHATAWIDIPCAALISGEGKKLFDEIVALADDVAVAAHSSPMRISFSVTEVCK